MAANDPSRMFFAFSQATSLPGMEFYRNAASASHGSSHGHGRGSSRRTSRSSHNHGNSASQPQQPQQSQQQQEQQQRRRRRRRPPATSSVVLEKGRAALLKRLKLLTDLMTNLDTIVFAELCTLYYMDCSFFRLLIRAIAQSLFLSPKSDDFLLLTPARRPHVYAIVVPNIICLLLHLLMAPAVASEVSRGYLQGGILIDFIGQREPSSRWILLLLDLIVFALQCVMLAAHSEREELRYVLLPKRRSTTAAAAAARGLANPVNPSTVAEAAAAMVAVAEARRGSPASGLSAGAAAAAAATERQDIDAEEQGVSRHHHRRSRTRSRRETMRENAAATDIEMQSLPRPSPRIQISDEAESTRTETRTRHEPDSATETDNDNDVDEPPPPPDETSVNAFLDALSSGANITDLYVMHALREAGRDNPTVAMPSLQASDLAERWARLAAERRAQTGVTRQ